MVPTRDEPASIARIVGAALGGNLEAFGKLVARFQDMAYAAAYAQLGDHHLAEDAAQDTFIEAFTHLASLREPAAFPGWFRQILRRRCLRIVASRGAADALSAPLDLPSELPEPLAVAEQRELQRAVLDAVRALPEHERSVTALFYVAGYPQSVIARFLEIPVATVKSRLHSARHRMRRSLTAMSPQGESTVRRALAQPRRRRPSRNPRFARVLAVFAAAQTGDGPTLESMLAEDHTLLEARNERAWTPLRVAAQEGHVEAVDALLVAGATVDCEAEFGATPLSRAAQRGHASVVARLLAAGASATHLGDGWSALQLAAQQGHAEIVGLLLRHGAHAIVDHQDRYDGWTALHRAAAAGSVETMQVLLEHGASVNATTGRSGQTALHLTIAGKTGETGDAGVAATRLAAARFLLARGVDIDAVDSYGATALQHAVQRGDAELIAVLRGAGAREPVAGPTPEQTARQLERAALSAVREASLPALTALLDRHPALVNTADHFGQTLLCLAAWRGDLPLVRFLIDRGADVTRHDPIHYAGYHGHREMCRLLVERGGVDHLVPDASPAARSLFRAAYAGDVSQMEALLREDSTLVEAQDASGYTPLHVAAGHGDVELMQVLLAHGADLESTCHKGRTILHRAAGHARREAVSLLLTLGARTDVHDRDGKTPLDLAVEKDRPDHRVTDLFFQSARPS